MICFLILGHRLNGHSKLHGRQGHVYESSSMVSSDLETTSFLESDDDASSHITTTTGRVTNLSIDRNTLGKRITFLDVKYYYSFMFLFVMNFCICNE